MALTERLAFVLTADEKDVLRGFSAVGKSADTDLVKAEKSIDRVGSRMQSVGAGSVALGATMAAGLYQAVQATQDLDDSWDKAKATFGKGAESSLKSFADTSADNLGKSSAAALDAASSYGLLLKSSSLTGSELAKTSAGLATRTADLAEEFKTSFGDANSAIANAIKTGSSRALKGLLEYGIAITETDIKNEALTSGIAKQGEVLTRQQKAQATAALIMKDSAKSAGFLKDSTDDSGVAIQKMQANWENAKASFGEASLPALTKVSSFASGILADFNKLPEPVKETASNVALVTTGVLLLGGAASTVGGTLLKSLDGAKSIVGKFRTEIAGVREGGISSALKEVDGGFSANAKEIGIATVAAVAWGAAISENARQAQEAMDALLPSVEKIVAGLDPKNPGVDSGLVTLLAGKGGPKSAVDKIESGLGLYDRRPAFGGDSRKNENIASDRKVAQEQLGQAIDQVGPARGRELVDQYTRALINAGISMKNLDAAVGPLYEKLDAADGAERAAKSTGAYAEALKSATPGTKDFATALDAAGVPIEKIDTFLASLGAQAGNTKPQLSDFAAAAAEAGIPLADLKDKLQAAGIEVDTFSSKQAAAAAKTREASSLVVDYERALIRQGKAKEAVDDFASKQAEAQQTANERVVDATDSVTDAIKRRAKAQQELNELNKQSAIAGSVPLLQQITRFAADAETTAKAAAAAAAATYGADSNQAINAGRAAADATRRREQAGGFLNQALAEKQGENAQKRADATDAVAQADKEVSRTSRERAKAEKEAQQTTKDADADRKSVQLDLLESTLGLQDAQGKLNAATADGATPINVLRDALQSAYEKGQITADQFGTLSGLLGGLATTAQTVIDVLKTAPVVTGPASVTQPNAGSTSLQPLITGGQQITVTPEQRQRLLGSLSAPGSTTSTSVTHNYNISATNPAATAAEIAARNKAKIAEQKLGR